ncbi:SRPBCC family protein [Bradyrhizobium sp. TZ2]
MSKPEFVYVTYIETSAERLWKALTDGDFTERYWFGYCVASDWKPGSPYRFARQGEGSVEGKIITADPPRRLTYTWDLCSPGPEPERTSRVTFDLDPHGKVMKLTVTHDELDERGKTLRDISGGWPMVLASLKSLLETGHALPADLPSSVTKEAAHG